MLELLRECLFPPACLACGAPRVALCEACAPPPSAALRFVLDGLPVTTVAPYEGIWRSAIVAFKSGERAYAEAFGALLRARFAADATIVPVPTTRRRRAQRGFDQAVELAAAYGGAVAPALRKRPGSAQHGLRRQERLALVERFSVPQPGRVAGRRVVLLDDVCTTGATLLDAAHALRTAGACVEGALVLAVARADRNASGTTGYRRAEKGAMQ